MKKHIRKKFLFERLATEEDIEKMNTVATLYALKEAQKLRPKKGDKGMFITDKNWLIQPFPFNNNGSHIWIPEPDPVLIYFDSDLQKRVINLFDESLAVLGFLALGTKETIKYSISPGKYKQFEKEKIWRKIK